MIHDEYKNLVDYMLGSFMEEMQITPEQFEVACLEGRNTQNNAGNAFNFHQGLFQQIWAANDKRIFIRMMTQRNLELQLQALDLIERRQNSKNSESDTETIDVKESEETPIKESSTIEQQPIDEILPVEENIPEDKFKRLNLFFEKETVDQADIKSRQEYLRAQRDKILEIKKKNRTRQLNESVKKSNRPSSGQVAQRMMNSKNQSVGVDPPEASLVLRKTLARRLRAEVVDNE